MTIVCWKKRTSPEAFRYRIRAGRFLPAIPPRPELSAAWLDPVMGIVGSILVARWSFGLLKDTSKVLLDAQTSHVVREQVIDSIENADSATVTDLHIWSIGPSIHNLSMTLVSKAPKRPAYYRAQLPEELAIVHSTIEVLAADEDQEDAR